MNLVQSQYLDGTERKGTRDCPCSVRNPGRKAIQRPAHLLGLGEGVRESLTDVRGVCQEEEEISRGVQFIPWRKHNDAEREFYHF